MHKPAAAQLTGGGLLHTAAYAIRTFPQHHLYNYYVHEHTLKLASARTNHSMYTIGEGWKVNE